MENETNAKKETIPLAAGLPAADSIEEMGEEMWTQPPLSSSNPFHKKMLDFDHSLRCLICGEFFNNPVSVIPCHHTFCSECIRNHFKTSLKGMKRTASCPTCRENVNTGGSDFKCLVPNRTVADLVEKFQVLRFDLKDNLCAVAIASNATNSAPDSKGEPNNERKRKRSPCLLNSTSSEEEEYSPETKKVVERRKKKSTTHYKHLKKKHLVELCRAEGLSTRGNEQELKNRHQEYVILYNAECDSFSPRPVSELVKEMARREQARQEESMQAMYNGSQAQSVYMSKLVESRKAAGEAKDTSAPISSGNPAFDAKLNSNFSKLVQQMRERTGKKKPPSANAPDSHTEASEKSPSRDASRSSEDLKGRTGKRKPPSANSPESNMEPSQQSPPNNHASHSSEVLQPTMVNGVTVDASSVASSAPNEAKITAQTRVGAQKMWTKLQSPSQPFHAQESLAFATNTGSQACASKPTKPMLRSSEKKKKKRPAAAFWTCAACTFVNKKHTWSGARCEMCSTVRNSPNKGTGDSIVLLEC